MVPKQAIEKAETARLLSTQRIKWSVEFVKARLNVLTLLVQLFPYKIPDLGN
jgi:hypothetical protein